MKRSRLSRLLSKAADKGKTRKSVGLLISTRKIGPIKIFHDRHKDGTGSIIYVTLFGIEIFGYDYQDE